jgi:hypothetical protein
MLLAVILTFYIVVIIFTLAMCKAAGKDKYKEQWIEQRKREEKEG